MIRALVIVKDIGSRAELIKAFAHDSLACTFAAYGNGLQRVIAEQKPGVLLLEVTEQLPGRETWEIIRKTKSELKLPVIALLKSERPDRIELNAAIDDFLTAPYDARELVLRITRLLGKDNPEGQPINGQGLSIDPDTCEVTVDGRKVDLTFKEYETLKLLASHKGHVFTREALLDKIWGFDYYGGDRTVDVHVRRLRSKIEQNRTYIETVRNIGYRFVKDA
jgi:two-component system, OmpR family, alkaline phosphatase synthesis response regulator PhoP